ncbi:MAG: class I SAM-dependent methyltransferase [candidate division Zixibacteria bacterium]
MMSSYRKFARVYDKIGSDNFSVKMFHYTKRILSRLRYRPKSILDLACGTGTAAVMWARKNTEVFGIDASADMLAMAAKKATKEKVKLILSQSPMTSFSIPQQVDLVTCYFDSLNYVLSLDDLKKVFTCVNRALYPGGYFIFDVNTPEAMKVLWGSEIYADETEDVAWIWKNCYYPKAKQAEVKATFFVRKGKIWERFDEIHAERGYTATEIKAVTQTSGFKLVSLYNCLKFSKPKRDSMRIAAVVQKPH